MFWMVAFLFWMVALRRRRRWRRYAMRMGAFPPWAWWDGRGPGDDERRRGTGAPPPAWRELEDQRSYVDALESRVAQLEERLDFTERLLAGRRSETPRAEG
jgi:hypothetical protein